MLPDYKISKNFFQDIVNLRFVLLIFLGAVLLAGMEEVFAEKTVSITKVLDVEKKVFEETLIDVGNYKRVFSDYVKSTYLLENSEEKTITSISLDFGILPLSVQVEHNILGNDMHELSVLSGDLKGSKILTKLERTWSYDGVKNMGTLVNMDVYLKTSGFLALLGLVNEDLIRYSIDNSLIRLVDYSNGNFVEEIKKTQFNKRGR